jgi:hypothetical protein
VGLQDGEDLRLRLGSQGLEGVRSQGVAGAEHFGWLERRRRLTDTYALVRRIRLGEVGSASKQVQFLPGMIHQEGAVNRGNSKMG